MEKEHINLRINNVEKWIEQGILVEALLKKDAPHIIPQFKKLISCYSYPDVEKRSIEINVAAKIALEVMDAIKRVGKKNKRAMLPDFERSIGSPFIEENGNNGSLFDMVYQTIRRLIRYKFADEQKKELLIKTDELLLEYLSKLSEKDHSPYTKKDYRRYALVGRIVCGCGYDLSDKREITIDSPNQEMQDVVKYILNAKAGK